MKRLLMLSISVLCVAAISPADTLKLSGFELTTQNGTRVTLTLDGKLQSISAPTSIIVRNSTRSIDKIGTMAIKKDTIGEISDFGLDNIHRNMIGEIDKIGNIKIVRGIDGRIKHIGNATIEYSSTQELVAAEGDLNVRLIFKIIITPAISEHPRSLDHPIVSSEEETHPIQD